MNDYIRVNKFLSSVETRLNRMSYIPVISSVGGTARMAYGLVEVVSALAGGILLACTAPLTLNKDRFFAAKEVAQIYSEHGLANVVRGFIETWWPLGFVILFPYDLSAYRMTYPQEDPHHHTYHAPPHPLTLLTLLQRIFYRGG